MVLLITCLADHYMDIELVFTYLNTQIHVLMCIYTYIYIYIIYIYIYDEYYNIIIYSKYIVNKYIVKIKVVFINAIN